MSDFFGKLKSGAGKVAFEADKMTRLNRAKNDLEKIKSQIQAQYAQLGEMYYKQRATTGVTGPAYDGICQAIQDLETQAGSKNEEVQRISAEIYAPQGAQPAPQPAAAPVNYPPAPAPIPDAAQPAQAPAQEQATTKFCPNCGKEMLAAVKFCPDCGTKV